VRPAHFFSQRLRLGLHDHAGLAVDDELQRPAGIAAGDHRLGREHRLQRHIAVVFIVRRIGHGQRVGIPGVFFVIRDVPEHGHPIVQAVALDQGAIFLLHPADPGEDQLEIAPDMAHRFDQQVLALQLLLPAGIKDIRILRAAVEAVAVERGVVEGGGIHLVVAFQPLRDIFRIGVDVRTGTDHLGIEAMDLLPEGSQAVIGGGLVIQVIDGAVLMQQPDDLVQVPGIVGREAQGDELVHGDPAEVVELDVGDEGHQVDDKPLRGELEREGHDLDLVPGLAQMGLKAPGMQFGAADDKRHLNRGDNHPHRL
jgi:hypothetical protein